MKPDIDKMQKEFFKKSLSVGYHNITYTWKMIMLMILSCVKGLESFEEGAKSPSAQTLRDRLNLNGQWYSYFHECALKIARYLVKRFSRLRWWISIDETYMPFFGNRKKLNKKFRRKGLGEWVHGYTAKTPGATGSFCFLVISLCCCKVRIPVAVRMIKVRERYNPWLELTLQELRCSFRTEAILADRGFGKAAWFYKMIDRLSAKFIARIPLRKKENKRKVAKGVSRFQYWMNEEKTNEKVLLTVFVAKDKQKRMYILASNIENKTAKQLLAMYLNRWDLENIFKDSERVLLPTSSPNPKMRLFSAVLAFFLFALWQISPFLQGKVCSLRTFVKRIIAWLCILLDCTITVLGRIAFRKA